MGTQSETDQTAYGAENASVQVEIGLDLHLIGWVARVFWTNHRAKQSKTKQSGLLATQLKIARSALSNYSY